MTDHVIGETLAEAFLAQDVDGVLATLSADAVWGVPSGEWAGVHKGIGQIETMLRARAQRHWKSLGPDSREVIHGHHTYALDRLVLNDGSGFHVQLVIEAAATGAQAVFEYCANAAEYAAANSPN